VRELIAKIQRVKREVSIPVTTAEVPNVWLEHPELASAVDYLAVHILPYWEGMSGSLAVDHAVDVYDRLRQAYPGKRIVIAEFGWPSAGLNRKDAVPSPLTQATVIRDFITRADAMGIDYSIVEAFDQPWKTFEGSVGPYWGIFDADRNPKFAFAGAVEAPNFLLKVIAALAIGVLLSIPIFAIPRVAAAQAAVLALTAQAFGAWSANVVDYWVTHYFVLGSQIALFAGAALLVPLIMIMKQRVEELAAIIFGAKPGRLLAPGSALPERPPLVSIHIPACREPPEMLRQTLDSVAQLDWPNLECVVVINNTPDPSMWSPIEDHCRLLGPRFKFVRADRLQGFKAGALRLALEHTAPEAEIIGVLDADYVVHPHWLKDLVGAFADPATAWREHISRLQARAAALNERRFDHLRYRGPGTDLMIGLHAESAWQAALDRSNGIDHVARVAPFADGATVLPVIVYYNGERLAADRVRLRRGADQDFVVADNDAGRAFAQLFEGTPLRVHCGDDFVTLAWRKLLINAVASPVTALTLQRQAVLRRPDIQTLCLAVLEEAITVGRAEGAQLAADEAARTLATLFTFSGELGTSMYFDRLAGRQLEHEALTGAIVSAGERHGIATPRTVGRWPCQRVRPALP